MNENPNNTKRELTMASIQLRKQAVIMDESVSSQNVPSKMDMFAWGMACGLRCAAGLLDNRNTKIKAD